MDEISEYEFKLKWIPFPSCGEAFQAKCLDGALTIYVQRCPYDKSLKYLGKYAGMWEIIIGLRFLSRDKKAYFTTEEKAMKGVEMFLKMAIEKLIKELKDEN